MVFDLAKLRDNYKREYATYMELASKAQKLLEEAVAEATLVAEIEGRAKDVPSLLRKAIRKHAEKPDKYGDPLTAISDKAGIRAVVHSKADAEAVQQIASRPFRCIGVGGHGQAATAPRAGLPRLAH